MAIVVHREKESGSLSSNRVPYFVTVENVITETLTRDEATQAALDQALIDTDGIAATDFTDRQLSNTAWRVEVLYSETRLGKLTLEPIGGVPEVGFRYQAESELITRSILTFDSGGLDFDFQFQGEPVNRGFAPIFGGLVGIQGGQFGVGLKQTGIQVTPKVTHWIRVTVANGTITDAYETQIGDVMGKVNKATYRGKPAGSFRFVSCSSTIRSDADLQITFGFDYRAKVPSRTITTIDPIDQKLRSMTTPEYDGHHLFWTYDEMVVWAHSDVDPNGPNPARSKVLTKQPMYWYIEQVHETADFATELGI